MCTLNHCMYTSINWIQHHVIDGSSKQNIDKNVLILADIRISKTTMMTTLRATITLYFKYFYLLIASQE